MGEIIKKDDLEIARVSEISRFIGEVYHDELTFLLRKKDRFFAIVKEGVSKRVFSEDFIDISTKTFADKDEIRELVFIHLSKDGIFHRFPEIFFFPLSFGSNKSYLEVSDAIKNNRKIQKDNITFFTPFDSELFSQNITLNRRYLRIFSDKKAKENLFSLANQIVDMEDIGLTKHQTYLLMLHLKDSEFLKENFSAIEDVLHNILEFKVSLDYKDKLLTQSPFKNLGESILGYDFGLHGSVKSEFDDIIATISLEKKLDYAALRKNIKKVKKIVSFFVLSNREIDVQFNYSERNQLILNESFLGYDTIIKN